MKTMMIAVAAGLLLVSSALVNAKICTQCTIRVERLTTPSDECTTRPITIIDAKTGEPTTVYVEDCTSTSDAE